jgi:hypothetical protein
MRKIVLVFLLAAGVLTSSSVAWAGAVGVPHPPIPTIGGSGGDG